MYCYRCGKEIPADASFCQWCGQEVKLPSLQSETDELISLAETKPAPQSKPKKRLAIWKNVWSWPIGAAILVTLVLGGYTLFELYTSRAVAVDLSKAENLALAGKVTEARSLVEKALAKRPQHKVLQADLWFLKKGEEIQRLLQNAMEQGKQKKYDQANTVLNQAEQQVQGKGSFYQMLRQQIKDKRIDLSVMQVKQEMNGHKTMEELIGLLSKVSAYDAQEAKALAQVIRGKIGDVVYTQANELISKNNFSGAQALVEQGLNYAGDNKKLLSLQKTIKEEKTAFEQAEQTRLAQAEAAAAKEDSINHSSAVQLLTFTGGVDGEGDFVLQGTVKNIATRPIYAIELYYTVYDAMGNELVNDSTYVYPSYLYPGDEGQFEATVYGLVNGQQVKITRTTWYLN